MNTKNIFPNLSQQLAAEIMEKSNIVDIPENVEVMREGQYVKAVPIVTDGLVKVYTRNEDKELLLYYIQPGESCIMSFDACLKNIPSKVYASTEKKSSILLMPVDLASADYTFRRSKLSSIVKLLLLVPRHFRSSIL